MIQKLSAILVLISFFSLTTFGNEPVKPKTKDVTVNVGDVFIPGGFDSRSDAFFIISGVFPNGCYKWKESIIDHKSAIEHEIRAIARVSSGMCAMVLVPFSREIRIGQLQSGNHTLRFTNDDGTYLEKTLVIE